MIEVVTKILQTILLDGEHDAVTALIPSEELGSEGDLSRAIPFEMVLTGFAVTRLPSNENFLEAMKSVIKLHAPRKLLVIPPFISSRHLSRELRADYLGLDFGAVVADKATELLPNGGTLALILPLSEFVVSQRGKTFRETLFAKAKPQWLITHDHSWRELGFHGGVKLTTLVLNKGDTPDFALRFFKVPHTEPESASNILGDLARLKKQGGGKTNYGYILQRQPEAGQVLLHEKYHPDLVERRNDLEHVGETKALRELVDFRRGIHLTNESNLLIPGDSQQDGLPVIGGRDIRADGTLDYEGTRYKAKSDPKFELMPGDVCIRAIIGIPTLPFKLHVAMITKNMPKLMASHSVIVLRPKSSVTGKQKTILLSYLRSTIAARLLAAELTGVQLYASLLMELPVPSPDEALVQALESLEEAAHYFDSLKQEALTSVDSLFSLTSVKDSRLKILSAGRISRQRKVSAELVDDFHYRVRTRFPHPIAYRWRTIETAHHDLERYTQVLECTEVILSYLAFMAIALAQSTPDVEIKHLKQMSDRLVIKGHGTSMGDWTAVLREVRDSKAFRTLPDSAPFYEVLEFLKFQNVDEAVQKLMRRRNDFAHNRGPKGSAVVNAFNESIQELETLLRAVEFTSEYPLRYIESTHWDSFKGTNTVTYRDLTGDHPLSPLNKTTLKNRDIELNSLYLIDRVGVFHLLRPHLTRSQCPDCGNWSTFFLDQYDAQKDICTLKSLERGHTRSDADLADAFRHVGLLSASK
jgi:hypothetical protein